MLKQKYPEYNDMDSSELGKKTLEKYPEYQDMISQENKKTGILSSLGTGVKELGKAIVKPVLKAGITAISPAADVYNLARGNKEDVS